MYQIQCRFIVDEDEDPESYPWNPVPIEYMDRGERRVCREHENFHIVRLAADRYLTEKTDVRIVKYEVVGVVTAVFQKD